MKSYKEALLSTMSTEKDVSTLDFDGLEEVDDVKPQIIGDFSMLRKEYLDDRRYLKFFNDKRFKHRDTNIFRPLRYDLNMDPKLAPPNSHEPGASLQGLLRWIKTRKFDLTNTDFVATRCVLKILMSAANEPRLPFNFKATKLGHIIYILDVGKVRENIVSDETERLRLSGFKFEHLLTTDEPSEEMAPNAMNGLDDHLVNPDEKFRCVLSLQMGKFAILYSAEMDGFLQTRTETTLKEDLDLTKDGHFVEMKTSKYNRKKTLRRFKFPNWWIQVFLGNNHRVILGLKSQPLLVTELREFEKDYLEKGPLLWSKRNCLAYLNTILGLLKKEVINEGEVYHVFKLKNSRQIVVQRSTDDQFVPGWFCNPQDNVPSV